MNRDLYCKLYVDTAMDRVLLLDLIGALCAGTVAGRTVTTEELEIDVSRNEDHRAARGAANDFVYFPYHLDVVPGDGVAREDYVAAIRALLHGLRELDMQAVAACDFEDELERAD